MQLIGGCHLVSFFKNSIDLSIGPEDSGVAYASNIFCLAIDDVICLSFSSAK